MSKIPENLRYTKDHEWVHLSDNILTVGITDFAQESLGDIVFIELPDQGQELQKGDSFGVVESIKSVSDLYAPLSGKVVEKNEQLEQSPEQINEDAYKSWILKLEVSDSSELENLMNASSYESFLKES